MNSHSDPTAFDSRVRLPGAVFAIVALAVAAAGLVTAQDAPRPDADETGFVPLFNGKDLAGWEGNTDLWKAQEGAIVGDSPGIKQNEFLATTKKYGDFELRLEFRLRNGEGNTGIQFRSKREPDSSAVSGYQADIGQNYWGCLYDEHRRNKVLVQAPPELGKVLRKDDWNTYAIRAEKEHVTLAVNGLRTVDYRESDEAIARDGIIALQVHSGAAMKIEFRRIRIKTLGDK